MGTDIRYVVMYGVSIDYETAIKNPLIWDEYGSIKDELECQFDISKDQGVRILTDGMSGEYAIIGIPVVYSGEMGDGVDIPITRLKKNMDDIDKKIKEFMGKYFPEISIFKPAYIVLTVYS